VIINQLTLCYNQPLVVIPTLFVGILMQVHKKIRSIRQSKNWSQEKIAEKLKMSTNGYPKIERGETKAHIPKLEQIAEILGLDLMELLASGEKNVFCLSGIISPNSSNVSQFTGTSNEIALEIQKQQLTIEHQLEEIIQLLKEHNL
jgi:transcriptional regulator with XRE-family HTH domain